LILNNRNKHLLFIFIDGVGLGSDHVDLNPFASLHLPCLKKLLDGKSLTMSNSFSQGERYTLVPLDACLGVRGMPQSATGQAVLLTGVNVPANLGYHFGPKPNDEVAKIITSDNIFLRLSEIHKKCVFVNAYPQRYFDAIESGRRLLSSIPLAVSSADLPLHNKSDLIHGNALSADLTGRAWHQHLGSADVPILTPFESGRRLVNLSRTADFTLFEYWLSDYAGHSQEMNYAQKILEELDEMICGLLSTWDDNEGLIIITSDHGNIEDLSTHRHTQNPVPGLIIGKLEFRDQFSNNLNSIMDITPAIMDFFRPTMVDISIL
jgi:2,3-bisphosphoglycerate-independent phosphoglycerate mutase